MKKTELKVLIKEEIRKVLNEDQSRKRGFLGIFNPDKGQFQRVLKKVSTDVIKNLSDYTKSNGDEVSSQGSSSWASTKDSRDGDQMVWYYNGKDLLFINLNYPSVYDNYIRTLTKTLKESSSISSFSIEPNLAFKIYDILSQQYPEIKNNETKSSFFYLINNGLKK